MTNGNNRLEQIEALQLQAQQQINATQRQLDATQKKIDANVTAIAALTARMDQAVVEAAQMRDDADADRKMIVGILEHMDEVHAENQRILNYLFGQQRGNGHGS